MFDPSKLNLDEPTPKNNGQTSQTGNADDTNTQPKVDILAETEISPTPVEPVKPVVQNTPVTPETPQPKVDVLSEAEIYSPKKATEQSINKELQSKEMNQPKLVSHKPEAVIFDVNLQSLKDIIQYLLNNKYDYVTFEPDTEKVTVIFRKDQTIAEKKYIPYPKYSGILLKAKETVKLNLAETELEQEGKARIVLDNKTYDTIAKTVPSKAGEKLFFKTVLSKNQEKAKQAKKKSSLAQMLSFLSAILIILLIIWGTFLSFVVLNAKTIDDVRFFENLGINLNQINNFIGTVVTITFLLILLIEFIALVVSLFKFILTKKEYKKKKLKFAIISTILLILTVITASTWMFIDRKVQQLPQWALEARGEVQMYDNARLISDQFSKEDAYISDSSALIWPVEAKFDVTVLTKKEAQKWLKVRKYIWEFNDEEIVTTEPELIKTFDKKWITNVKLTLEEIDAAGSIVNKNMEKLPIINISALVNITSENLKTGGKRYTLDASDLKVRGQAVWYDLANLKEPKFIGYKYITDTPITEDTLMGLYMKNASREEEVLDQIFILKWENQKNLAAKISYQASIGNDLEYTISAKNIVTDTGTGWVDTFKWIIDDKEYTKEANFIKLEESSTIKHIFKKYGTHTITLQITDLAGNTQTITKELEINKSLTLKSKLRILSEKEVVDSRYDAPMHEYFIDNLPVPTKVQFDARFLRAQNPNYYLKDIEWDFNNDKDVDAKGKKASFDILKSGTRTVKVNYIFENKRNPEEIVNLTETLYFESIQKDAILDFKVIKTSDYIPTKVKVDASKSMVKGKDISKFVWDFGDGTPPQAGDSIVDGHYYNKEWDYEIKLTIVTSDGEKHHASKKLILKPTPQEAKIRVSMKNAPTFQEIDFSSAQSTGEIIGYFWEFGDGESSSKANPSHSYKKSGKYEVKLRLDYRNNNFKEATQIIEIE